MPQIIVVADNEGVDAVMLRERVSSVVFETEHSAGQLLERLEWAVGDAQERERHCAVSSEDRDARWSGGYTREASVLTTAS